MSIEILLLIIRILLSYRLEAKITDLGVAKVVKGDSEKTMTKLPGTSDFMPPEAKSIRPVYGPLLDVFSYGGVILNVTNQLWPQPTDRNPDTDVWEIVSEVERCQHYLDKMAGGAADLKPLVMSCLNDSPKNRPPLTEVSMAIKRVKDEKSNCDKLNPIVWWAEVSNNQESQVSYYTRGKPQHNWTVKDIKFCGLSKLSYKQNLRTWIYG